MKHKMRNRFISVALAAVMIAGIVPSSAFADVTEEPGTIVATSQAQEEENPELVLPESSEAPSVTPVPESSEAPAVTPVPESSEAPAVTPVPESSEAPTATPVPESNEAPAVTPVPESSEVPTATPAPESSQVPAVTPAPTSSPMPSETPVVVEQEENDAENYSDLYNQLMAANNVQEIEQILSSYSEDELNAFEEALSEDEYTALVDYINAKQAESGETLESKVFTDAGPFMAPVVVGSSALSMMAANSVLNTAPMNNQDELKYSKTLENWNQEQGTGTLVLEAYATGEYKTTVVEEAVPVDIVLVLDQSGSMAYSFPGSNSRQQAMKNAVNNFISAVNDKYSATADHRMAIVTFGNNSKVLAGWTNVDEYGESYLSNQVNKLKDDPSGATRIDTGMQSAENLLTGSEYYYSGTNTTRHKVVIVFTDGVPTENSEFNTDVANSAIQSAYRMKNQNVTVYSIGIFSGVNKDQLYGSEGFDTNSDGSVGSRWISDTWGFFPGTDFPETDVPAANRFLNYLSNNFKSATSVGLDRQTSGLGIFHYKIIYTITEAIARDTDKYYLTATDQTSLNQIFETIKEEIGSGSTTVTLNAESVVRDVMSNYFTVNGQVSDIKVYAVPATGKANGEFTFDSNTSNWKQMQNAATISADGKTIDVTGFDFSARYVTENARENNYYGEKIRIEIPIKVDYTKTLGGNAIPTNGNGSGIYIKKNSPEAEALFTSPEADVNINYGFETKDSSIYVTQSENLKNLIQEQVMYNEANVPVNGDTNRYVNIQYDVFSNGEKIATYKIDAGNQTGTWTAQSNGMVSPSECTTYTVKCAVSPSKTPANTSGVANNNIEKTATVHVFVPTITWKDSKQAFNTTLTEQLLNAHQNGEVVWEDSKQDNGPTPTTQVPVLSYEFYNADSVNTNLVGTNLTEETHVKVKVFMNAQDITSYTTFAWVKGDACEDCTNPNNAYQFRIHMSNGNLVIEKTLNSFNASKGDSVTFLFKVTNQETNKEYYQSIHFSKQEFAGETPVTKQVAIKGLPAGNYTVTELAANGYQQVGTATGNTATVGGSITPKVAFVNASKGGNVPGGNDYADNQFTFKDGQWTWNRAQ